MFCPKCGKTVLEGAVFCSSCGNALQETLTPLHQQMSEQTTVNTDSIKPARKKHRKLRIGCGVIGGLILLELVCLSITNAPNNRLDGKSEWQDDGREWSEETQASQLVSNCNNAQDDGESFTDSRDCKTYRIVRIGSQTWMAENLNYQTGNSWCYDCNKYGRLYDWNTAMRACPTGWRLPTYADWDVLVSMAGGMTAGMTLKSRVGWDEGGNGRDAFGFSALPSGFRNSGGFFDGIGKVGRWWSANEEGDIFAYYRFMLYFLEHVTSDMDIKFSGHSVRCVRD